MMARELATFIVMVAGLIMSFVAMATSKNKIMTNTWIGVVIFEAVHVIAYYVTRFY